MKRNSKKPAERRKELVDAAAHLFAEKGYENASVRDILDAVGGAPGMFYYYFKSKQDIYVTVMEDFISERISRKCEVMEDDERSFDERISVLRSLVEDDVDEYVRSFDPEPGNRFPMPRTSFGTWSRCSIAWQALTPSSCSRVCEPKR